MNNSQSNTPQPTEIKKTNTACGCIRMVNCELDVRVLNIEMLNKTIKQFTTVTPNDKIHHQYTPYATMAIALNMLHYDLVKYVNLAQNSTCVLHVTVLHVTIMMVWYVLLISYPLFALDF